MRTSDPGVARGRARLRAAAMMLVAGGVLTAGGALLTGCGRPRTGALVTGAVSLDGRKLDNGSISFYPLAAGDGAATRSAGSTIGGDGGYRVEVMPGRYRVEITSSRVVGQRKTYADVPDSPLEDVLEEVVPVEYNTASKLTQDITLETKVVDFDLQGGTPASRQR